MLNLVERLEGITTVSTTHTNGAIEVHVRHNTTALDVSSQIIRGSFFGLVCWRRMIDLHINPDSIHEIPESSLLQWTAQREGNSNDI